MISAHPVDAPAWGSGGGAQVEAGHGRRVGGPAEGGTEEELPQLRSPAVDVSAYQIGVAALQLARAHRAPREDQVPEPRGEPLDLRLYPLRHVHGGPVWDVAVGPCSVLSRRRPRRIEKAGLGQQHVWPIRVTAIPWLSLGARHLVQRAGQVHRARARTLRRLPGDRAGKRPVHLEYTCAVPEILQLPSIAPRESIACDP